MPEIQPLGGFVGEITVAVVCVCRSDLGLIVGDSARQLRAVDEHIRRRRDLRHRPQVRCVNLLNSPAAGKHLLHNCHIGRVPLGQVEARNQMAVGEQKKRLLTGASHFLRDLQPP